MAQVEDTNNAPLLQQEAEKLTGQAPAEITDKPIASRIKSVLQWNQKLG